MDALEYLRQLRRLDVAIRQKSLEIEMLREQAVYHGQPTSGERVQSSGVQDGVGSQVARIIDMSDRLQAERMNLVALREEIVGNIQALPDPVHSEVLYKRYVEYKSWRRIAGEMRYSADHVRGALHNAALRSFDSHMHRQGPGSRNNTT